MSRQEACKIILDRTKYELFSEVCILIFGLNDCITTRELELEKAIQVFASDVIDGNEILDTDDGMKICEAMIAWAERWI